MEGVRWPKLHRQRVWITNNLRMTYTKQASHATIAHSTYTSTCNNTCSLTYIYQVQNRPVGDAGSVRASWRLLLWGVRGSYQSHLVPLLLSCRLAHHLQRIILTIARLVRKLHCYCHWFLTPAHKDIHSAYKSLTVFIVSHDCMYMYIIGEQERANPIFMQPARFF